MTTPHTSWEEKLALEPVLEISIIADEPDIKVISLHRVKSFITDLLEEKARLCEGEKSSKVTEMMKVRMENPGYNIMDDIDGIQLQSQEVGFNQGLSRAATLIRGKE